MAPQGELGYCTCDGPSHQTNVTLLLLDLAEAWDTDVQEKPVRWRLGELGGDPTVVCVKQLALMRALRTFTVGGFGGGCV